MPTDAYSWGVLIVSSSLSVNGNYARQQVYHDNQNKIWARELWGSSASNVWKPWIRIDNFGTSSLSELASALGVGMIRQNINIPAGQTVYVDSDIYGLLCIMDETIGRTAIYSLNNGNYVIEKIMGYTFPGKDNPGTFNIYYQYGGSQKGLYLQNLASSQKNIKYSIL